MSEKKRKAKILALSMSLILMLAGCGAGSGAADESENGTSGGNGKVMILYTSDMHCAVDEGFGLAGLEASREKLEAEIPRTC